ncbi:MAG TPA: pitrilysin family protein [Candidatus Methylomirabilis sp.]|nr:pitrilysin family protein [Candidatus Methylomirabilis sp.]
MSLPQDKNRLGHRFNLRQLWRFFYLILGIACLSGATHAGVSPADEAVRATLDNGLRVVIVRDPLAPVVTTVVNYQVGSNEAPAGLPGTAHAVEHMMFRGSPGLSADQLAEISAAMGGNFDADTQQAVTQYFFSVPAEDLDLALHIEAIRMRDLLSTADLWKHERGAIEQEVVQDLSSPEYVCYTRLLAALFKGTPYAHDALGTRASFDHTSAAMLREFHATWYAPNNAILVIAGNVDPSQALAQVRRYFASIPRKRLPGRMPVRLQPVMPETMHLDTDQPYGTAIIAFRLPGYDDPDYAAASVLADALSSQRGDLYDLVVQGKALNASFSLNPLSQGALGFVAVAYPSGADVQALLNDVRRILKKNITHGIPPDLVEAARRRALASAEFRKNSISGLAMLWSQALAVEGRASPDDDLAAIKRVTPADVGRVARKYLDLDHAVTAVLTPTSSGRPVTAKGFGGRESFAPSKVRTVALPDWAGKVLQRLSVPDSNVHPTVMMLPNGIRLIVQTEDVSDTVSLYGHIRNRPELQEPPGREGVDDVLDQLFSYGTTSLDRLAFQKALDDIAADESAGTDFSVQVLRPHFDRAVELLADNELRPALPEPAFQIVQRQVAAAIAGRNASPDYLAGRALHSALFPPRDPTLRESTPQTVTSLSLDDVRDYYRHGYRPDLTTIVVIGRISAAEARATIEKYFGGWKAVGPKPETLLPPVPLNKPSVMTVPDHSRLQDEVTLVETLGLNRFNPDYYALQLGNHVLGGGFYATRLYRDLRENAGLVYFVASSFDVGQTRAVYQVNYACDPPNVSRVRTIVERDLTAMQAAPVKENELRNAKATLLREIPLSESSTDSIAMGFLARVNRDLPLDEPLRAARQYAHLTAAAVTAAFARWVRPQDLVQITQGPAPH